MQAVFFTSLSPIQYIQTTTVFKPIPNASQQDRPVLSEQEILRCAAAGLKSCSVGADNFSESGQQVDELIELNIKIVQELIERDANQIVQVERNGAYVNLEEMHGSTTILVGEGQHVLPGVTLQQAQQNLVLNIVSRLDLYAKHPKFISYILRHVMFNREKVEYRSAVRVATEYVCDNHESVDEHLRFLLANHMLQNIDQCADQYLLKIAELTLNQEKTNLSIAESCKEYLENSEDHCAELIWSAALYAILTIPCDAELFQLAVDCIIDNDDLFSEPYAAKAAYKFVQQNESFFTSPIKFQDDFVEFFDRAQKRDTLEQYSRKLTKILQSDKPLYKGSGDKNGWKMLVLWCDCRFEFALTSNKRIAFYILKNIQHPAIQLWNAQNRKDHGDKACISSS